MSLLRKIKRNTLKQETGNNKIQEEWKKEKINDLPLDLYYKKINKKR